MESYIFQLNIPVFRAVAVFSPAASCLDVCSLEKKLRSVETISAFEYPH
jgi:hypothetical protein